MENKLKYKTIILFLILAFFGACKSIQKTTINENRAVPTSYKTRSDSTNMTKINWRKYFVDENLIALIDSALINNQELKIMYQEIEITKNEIRSRKGEYLPYVNLVAGTGLERPAQYTAEGSVEHNLEIKSGKEFPDPLGDFVFGARASWEIDIWKKLRNAKASSISKYFATIEGKNFMITNLIAEIADAYYELMAYDNLLNIVQLNIEIQSNAFNVVKQQKEFAKVTQLAVNRFEAQLLNTQNLQFTIQQKITEIENRINFLCGRFPQPINRSSDDFLELKLDSLQTGLPVHLLQNRPDIRQAELELVAAKLDVRVARANFYPSLSINTGIGFRAFNPTFLINPESLLYNLAGEIVAPLINRNGIIAVYNSATSKQIIAVTNYEKSILNAYVDVLNQIAKIDNFTKSFNFKKKEVDILSNSIVIANSLFNSARADYTEVLLTQREALEAKMELIEIKAKQLNAKVNIYRALGGGWN